MKYFEKRKLVKYEENIRYHTSFDYKTTKQDEINCLQWLISSYEGKTASTPKQLLEALLSKDSKTFAKSMPQIIMLYNWVYYKRITGF